MPEFRDVEVGELKLRCAIEGQGPLVVMVHGFPESWYSWRHQIGPIATAGFTPLPLLRLIRACGHRSLSA